ncbi:MAG: hypothetical protein HY924_12120 [Elusimicrobia bacterium]|nr:hypothetical protein [Elusimicrobiota bacterium]
MKTRQIVWTAVVLGGFLLHAEPGRVRAQPGPARALEGCGLTYAGFAKPFVESYCLRCHSSANRNFFTRRGAPKGVDFDAYAGICEKSAKIKRLAVLEAKMPKGKPKPTREERERLGAWLDCGLPR